ncbi:hypothetical protein CPB85DRAFT_626450 [Mucidula mucida]|nr:hypothetical protein CPB85DRAFT_626450 [Mucidula mucida]
MNVSVHFYSILKFFVSCTCLSMIMLSNLLYILDFLDGRCSRRVYICVVAPALIKFVVAPV